MRRGASNPAAGATAAQRRQHGGVIVGAFARLGIGTLDGEVVDLRALEGRPHRGVGVDAQEDVCLVGVGESRSIVEGHRAVVLGLPISRSFEHQQGQRATLAAQLGWSLDRPTITLIGGGDGLWERALALVQQGQLLDRMRAFQEKYEFIVSTVSQVPPFDATLDWPVVQRRPRRALRCTRRTPPVPLASAASSASRGGRPPRSPGHR